MLYISAKTLLNTYEKIKSKMLNIKKMGSPNMCKIYKNAESKL